MTNDNKFVASLHTHVRSLFDADISPDALCKRIKELGGNACAITDHGVLSSIEDFRAVFSKYDLKLIPGVEVYVDGGLLGRLHLILLATNDQGYRTIGKIVSESNKNMSHGFPVVTMEILKTYIKGDGSIIALSGCMDGVICSIFLTNNKIDKKIQKQQKEQGKYTSPTSSEYLNAKSVVADREKALEDAITKRDLCKKCAEQPFKKRESAVAKLEKAGDPSAKEERERLEEDKVAAQKAADELPLLKDTVEKAKKASSSASATVKDLDKSVTKYNAIEEQIIELRKELGDDAEIKEKAKETLLEYASLFGNGNFFAELQYHGLPEEEICYPRLCELAKECNIPIVATNDVHILTNSEDERLKRQILRSMRFKENFEEEGPGSSELYLKDNNELATMLEKIIAKKDVDSAIENIAVISERCNVKFEVEKHYPKMSKTEDSEVIFKRELEKGIKWRFPDGMDEAHQKRLEYEVNIIKSMGYIDYHLVVKDFLEYGRLLGCVPDDKIDEAPLTIEALQKYIEENEFTNEGLSIGPGRGSAAGSLVCYILGITNLDPLKYDLLFERFLNPERISMPDIDSDIYSTGRKKVIEYVKNKYGENAVCAIMTMTFQGPKGSIKTAAKYYGFKKYKEPLTALGNQIAKEVPDELGIAFTTTVTGTEDTLTEYLNKKFSDNKDALEVIRWATILEGSFTSYSEHAAGVVISDGIDISDVLPLRTATEDELMTTQCTKEQVEENGFLKFDLLGLTTLDIITQTVRNAEKTKGIVIDPLKIDMADKRVYREIFSKGRTNAVFQFESAGMKSMLKRFKPENFEDLIILVSMFRPGPLQYLDSVIDVKQGNKEMSFLCPELEPILGKTYGAIVYQEQVMKICQQLAGFTLGHADQVRKYMSKKKADKLEHERDLFINGCTENGIPETASTQLFNEMMDFAKYAFNKSHAACYAFLAYITSWLKLYYPAEFFAAALNWADKPAKLSGLMYEAKEMGVSIKAPNINVSAEKFEIKSGDVVFGLSSVAGVKNNALPIVEERKKGRFTSVADFILRCDPNIKVITNLIDAGAFDEFSKNRQAMKEAVDKIKEIHSSIKAKESFLASANFVLPKIESFSTKEELLNYQRSNGYKEEVKSLCKPDSLSSKIDETQKVLKELKAEAKGIKEPKISENKKERMNTEKKLLGIYVTEHPVDFYPSYKELDVTPINDVDKNTEGIYGVITNLVFKNKKATGEKMAFFTLEDKSGSINVSCFTKEYARYSDLIQEGNVLKISGNVIEDVFSNGEELEVELKFVAKKIETVKEKKCSYLMAVSSYAAFYLDAEEEFIKLYADENGHDLLIYDKTLNEVREFKIKVSESVLKLKNVEEVYI